MKSRKDELQGRGVRAMGPVRGKNGRVAMWFSEEAYACE